MPRIKLLASRDVDELDEKLAGDHGASRMTQHELLLERKAHGLKKPRGRKETELPLGYKKTCLNLQVVGWTGLCVDDTQEVYRAAWVIIREAGKSDRRLYSSKPMHHTKNFVERFTTMFEAALWRIQNPPECLDAYCGNFMTITKRRAPRSRFYVCKNSAKHAGRRPLFKGFDTAVPKELRVFLSKLRAVSAKHRIARREAGKKVFVTKASRQSWKGRTGKK